MPRSGSHKFWTNLGFGGVFEWCMGKKGFAKLEDKYHRSLKYCKNLFTKEILEATSFVALTVLRQHSLLLATQGPQKHHKPNGFRELLCNHFGQDGTSNLVFSTLSAADPRGRERLTKRIISLGVKFPGIVPKSPYFGCQFARGAVRISAEMEGKLQKIGR